MPSYSSQQFSGDIGVDFIEKWWESGECTHMRGSWRDVAAHDILAESKGWVFHLKPR